ncbi:MAG: Arc family DNA-binding protein [bacterium]|jgi:hypothetical protein|nr:Arc family DNA-binding protein [bacterium]
MRPREKLHVECMHMVALQIREVPEEVRDVLAARARAQGRSLQAYLLEVVTSEARRSRNVAILQEQRERLEELGRGATSDRAVLEAIHEARRERDERLLRILDEGRRASDEDGQQR